MEQLSEVHEIKQEPDNKSTCSICLQALGNCINKPIVFKGIKTLVFIFLLVLVIHLYGIEIYTEFESKATTFKTKTHEADNFNMPPITICMGNGLKATVMKKYGISTIFEFVFGAKAVINLSSVWDVFVEGSYIINRDFKIVANDLTLSKGYNIWNKTGVGSYEINVTQYHTILSGTCYQIESSDNVPPPKAMTLTLNFSESLDKIDIPQVFVKKILT